MYLETKHNCCFVDIPQLSVQHDYVFKSHFMHTFSFWNGLGFNFILTKHWPDWNEYLFMNVGTDDVVIYVFMWCVY